MTDQTASAPAAGRRSAAASTVAQGRRRARISPSSASAPSEVRAQATVSGP